MYQYTAWYFKCLLLFGLSIGDLLQILVLVDQFTKITSWVLQSFAILQMFLCLNVIVFRFRDMSKSVITLLKSNRYDDILIFITSIILFAAIQYDHYEETFSIFAAYFVASTILNMGSVLIYSYLLSEFGSSLVISPRKTQV